MIVSLICVTCGLRLGTYDRPPGNTPIPKGVLLEHLRDCPGKVPAPFGPRCSYCGTDLALDEVPGRDLDGDPVCQECHEDQWEE